MSSQFVEESMGRSHGIKSGQISVGRAPAALGGGCRRVWFVLCLSVLGGLAGCDRLTAEEHLAQAISYEAAGEFDAALIELKNSLSKEPALGPARAAIGHLYFSASDYREAESEFGRALTYGVPQAELQPRWWLTQIRLQQASEVVSALGDGSATSAEQRAVLGLARLALADVELAQQDFAAALSADDGSAYAHYGLALMAWRGGNPRLAEQHFTRAVAREPNDPELWLDKAEFELGRQELASARAGFQAAKRLPGRNIRARLGEARVLIVERKFDAARIEIDTVLTLAPTLVPALYLSALVAYESDDLNTAELALREVQSSPQEYPPAHYLMGAVKFRQQKYAQAEVNLGRYLTNNSGNWSARKLLAAVRTQQGNPAGVIEVLDGMDTATADPQTLAMLGSAYAQTGRPSDAAALLEQAVAKAPDVGSLRNQLAVTLLAAGDSADAIGQLRSAIDLDEDLVLSEYLLVLAQLRDEQFDSALATATALRERDPADPMGDNLVGAVYLAQRDYPAASEAYRAALSKQPTFSAAAMNLVSIELLQERPAAARAVLHELLAADPDNASALLRLAELDVSTGDLGSAISGLRQAATAHPKALAPRLALARLGLRTNDITLAETFSAQANELAPDNPQVVATRVEALLNASKQGEAREPLARLPTLVLNSATVEPQMLLALGRLQERTGLNREAREVYLRIAGGGDLGGTAADMALMRLDMRSGDLEGARRKFERLPNSAKTSVHYKILAADLEHAQGNTETAADAYQTLLGSGNRDALFRLVALYTQSGDSEALREMLLSWLEKHENDVGAEIALANVYLFAQQYPQSQALFESIVTKQQGNVVALNNLAWLYMQLGDPRARTTAERAYEIAPNNPDIADTLGWILLNEGDLDGGSKVLEEALALSPNNATILFHTATARVRKGRVEQAIAALQRTAGRTFPEAEQAAELIRSLTID